MTQILQANAVNTLALGAPKAIVAVQPPAQPITGVQTNILGLIGFASWGPTNVALIAGGNDEQTANFGPVTNRKYDLSTAVAIAVQQNCSSFKCVRVSDGTDTAASGTYASSEVQTTLTVGGTAHSGDQISVVFAPTAGSNVTVNYQVPTGSPTLNSVASGLEAALAGTAALAAAGFAFSVNGAVVSVYGPGGTAPGTGWTSITPSVSGGGATTTLTGSTATASTIKLTLTALYTGLVGIGLVGTLQPGTAAASTALVISRPGYVSEKFDNLTGMGNLLWQNIASAVNNGNSQLRGPSQLCAATAGAGGAAGPSSPTNISMTGGTDGAGSSVSPPSEALLLGQDTAPRKGIFALRNQGCGVICPVDSSVTTYWTDYGPLGQSEGALVEVATASGDTLTNAATELSTAGVDNYGLKVDFGDWVTWYDEVNQTTRLVSPATFLAAMRANLAPQQSVLNKEVNGVIGTQKTSTNGVWSDADKDALYGYRMDLLCNPVPGGSYWGANNGINSSSNSAESGDNYTMMTNFIARSVAGWAGSNVGLLQDPDQRTTAKGLADDFFNNMWQTGMIGNADSANGVGSPPWSVQINDQTTPPAMAAAGYEIAAVRVQYLAVIRWFIVNLMGGQTVSVSVQNSAPAFTQ